MISEFHTRSPSLVNGKTVKDLTNEERHWAEYVLKIQTEQEEDLRENNPFADMMSVGTDTYVADGIRVASGRIWNNRS